MKHRTRDDAEWLYVRSMGKLLRVEAFATTDDEANAMMVADDKLAVVAVFGGLVLMANRWDKGE